MGAVDGAICAQQNGGKWYDGAMAGAIGGSASCVVSFLLYDVSYDLFNSGHITGENLIMYTADITMDVSMCSKRCYLTTSREDSAYGRLSRD